MKNKKFVKTLCLALSTLTLVAMLASCSSAQLEDHSVSVQEDLEEAKVNAAETGMMGYWNSLISNPFAQYMEDSNIKDEKLPETDPIVPDETDPVVPDETDPVVPDDTDPVVPDSEEQKVSFLEQFRKYLEENDFLGKATLEEFRKYVDAAEEWDVSVVEAQMVFQILEWYPEMTSEEVLALTAKERMALVEEHMKQSDLWPAYLEEYQKDFEELKEKYAEMFALMDEINVLREQLRIDETLTEEEQAEIREDIKAKQAEIKTYWNQFKEDLSALNEQYKEKAKEHNEKIKEELKQKAEELKEQLNDRLEELKKQQEEQQKDLKEFFEKKKEEQKKQFEELKKQNDSSEKKSHQFGGFSIFGKFAR